MNTVLSREYTVIERIAKSKGKDLDSLGLLNDNHKQN
jgi:hypothetical protein